MPDETVWLVWCETGEHSQWMLHLEGVYATEELADEHRRQILARGYDDDDDCYVTSEPIRATVNVE